MPWCPVCKNEYVEGKTHCPDCDADLVDELSEPSGLPEEEEEVYIPTEEEWEELAAERVAARVNTYTSAKSKYWEMKSSAWTFLSVGSAGFLFITSALLGIIRLPLNTFSLAVMDAVFAIFLGIAVVSFLNAGKLMADISKEDDLEKRVRAWMQEKLSAEDLTAELEDDITEEMKYFAVAELIRDKLMHAFPEVDDAYAEELTELFYNELFS